MINKVKAHKKIIVTAFLLLCLSFGVTLAYAKTQSNVLTNTFTAGSVETVIEEELPKPQGSDIKKAPYVKNTGENDALVRMRVTMTPSDLVAKLNIELAMNVNWTYKEDGYYYYNKILKSGEASEPLFTKVTGNDIVKDGKYADELEGLEIAVYHEAIQNLVKDKNGQSIQAITGIDGNAFQIWSLFDSLER